MQIICYLSIKWYPYNTPVIICHFFVLRWDRNSIKKWNLLKIVIFTLNIRVKGNAWNLSTSDHLIIDWKKWNKSIKQDVEISRIKEEIKLFCEEC
jgi:hypothetical protein